MTQPLRERLRETMVAEILRAAEEIFAEQGLHEAKMGDIAQRAGVAVGTLYNHFEDREALLAELLEARRQELLAAIDERLAALSEDGFEPRLRGLLLAMLTHMQTHARFFNILMQGEPARWKTTASSAGRGPRKTIEQLLARLSHVIDEGVRVGRVRPALAELGPVMLFGMVKSVTMRAHARGKTGELLTLVEPLLDFFLHGAAAR